MSWKAKRPAPTKPEATMHGFDEVNRHRSVARSAMRHRTDTRPSCHDVVRSGFGWLYCTGPVAGTTASGGGGCASPPPLFDLLADAKRPLREKGHVAPRGARSSTCGPTRPRPMAHREPRWVVASASSVEPKLRCNAAHEHRGWPLLSECCERQGSNGSTCIGGRTTTISGQGAGCRRDTPYRHPAPPRQPP